MLQWRCVFINSVCTRQQLIHEPVNGIYVSDYVVICCVDTNCLAFLGGG
jgi:hypothetical protein